MAFKYITTFLFLFLTLVVYSQKDTNRFILGETVARMELSNALTNPQKKQVKNPKIEKLEEQQKAIEYAESILFKTYKKKNIIAQRPYETYLIDKYWVISGTLAKNMEGGTFLIILDSKDGSVLKLIHGQ